eukprot:scaffold87572_cov20-Tisochrysis_lutea.AAC.2
MACLANDFSGAQGFSVLLCFIHGENMLSLTEHLETGKRPEPHSRAVWMFTPDGVSSGGENAKHLPASRPAQGSQCLGGASGSSPVLARPQTPADQAACRSRAAKYHYVTRASATTHSCVQSRAIATSHDCMQKQGHNSELYAKVELLQQHSALCPSRASTAAPRFMLRRANAAPP